MFERDVKPFGKTHPLHPTPVETPTRSKAAWNLILQLLTPEAKATGLGVEAAAVVGRSGQESTLTPDLDLTAFDALQHGISRQHALLLPTDDGLALIDLESTNGTWVNGLQLPPGHKHLLRSGDRIEFGTLGMVVRVVGQQGVPALHSSTSVVRPRALRR